MKRVVTGFSIDADVAMSLQAARERLRMTSSEIVNRLLIEWLTKSRSGSVVPASPLPTTSVPATVHQRARELAEKEIALRKAPRT